MPAQFTSQTGTLGNWSTHSPDEFDWSGNEDGFYPVSRLRQQYLDYLAAKVLEYEEQKQARHYYHGAQWSPEEVRVLRGRRQPVITFNETGKKIDQIIGLVQRLRQDPKAYPRNPNFADGAEIATQCLRNVLDAGQWDFVDPFCARQAAIEGIGGIEVKLIEGDHQDPDVTFDFILGDDFYYDPRSFKPDFSDARYMGIAKWLDVEAAIELFPDKEEELRTLMVETGFDLTTHADREYKWVYVNEHRLRLVEHWYKHRGRWFWAFFVSFILLDQGVSPFVDERRRPMNRFIMFSSNVDHEGDRYGFSRNFKGPQDEVNQRRSKALHISNNTRLMLQKGAVDDVETTRREAARPDGIVEYNMGFDPPAEKQKDEDLSAHLALMQDARQQIQGFANINPAMLNQDDRDFHSGVAINLLQKAGIAELGSFLHNYRNWKIRVYRALWNTIQHAWRTERWVRVTQNNELASFLAVNQMALNQWGQPVITNQVGALDVDIVLDEGPDSINLMQDTYEMLKDDPTVPWQIKLKFMPMASSMKKQIEQEMAQAQQNQPPDPKLQAEQIKAQAQQQKSQAEIGKAQLGVAAERESMQRDAVAHQQDAAIERERAAVELQRIRMEMMQAQQEHQFKMEQFAEQRKTAQMQHAQKRRDAAKKKVA